LLYYDFVNGVKDEEEYVLLVGEPNLFAIGTITLPKLEILAVVVLSTREPIFYFLHTLGEILVDITTTRIIVQDMKMAKWNLSKEVQIHPFNWGTHEKP
jgi:hypothetical protein